MALDRSWRRISWVILGIGGMFLAGGLALGWGSLRHVLYAERADGEVIEIRREGDMYAPVLRFRLASGETQDVKDLGSGAPDFAVGDRVTVLYMPDDPEDFRIDTFERLWFSSIFVVVFASLWLLFGGIAWGLARGVELAVLGEGAFAVIAVVATALGILALWNAVGLYTDGLRAEGTVLEVRRTSRTEDETVTPVRRQRGAAPGRAVVLCAGRALRHERGPRDRVPRARRQRDVPGRGRSRDRHLRSGPSDPRLYRDVPRLLAAIGRRLRRGIPVRRLGVAVALVAAAGSTLTNSFPASGSSLPLGGEAR